MGKAEDAQNVPSSELGVQGSNPSGRNSRGCCWSCCIWLKKLVTFKCGFILVLGVAVLLSAVFWLPFFHFGDHKDLDLDYGGRDIVARFLLNKTASFLQGYISQLEDDIFEEMSFYTTKVEVLSLEPLPDSNMTKIVFAVESDLTARSLIRASFVYLITRQSSLHLSAPLFGDPFSFEVLKFRGGITASPEQKAFLMQSVQILFNFTLNFSIDQLLTNFDELTRQLNKGLHLSPFENLYIRLTNLKGSTVDPPTTVQSQVLLAVGINPSKSRLKQLAQTITGSHAKNLGLNNTVFGRVKQIQLSSILQHSLGNDGGSLSPSPSPLPLLHSPRPTAQYHHHHHHHQRAPPPISPSGHRYGSGKRWPTSAPVSAPAPVNKAAKPPAFHFGYYPWRRCNKHPPVAPSRSPVYAPQPKKKDITQKPSKAPVPAASPSRNVAYAHSHAKQPDVMSLVSPATSPSSAGILSSNIWNLLLFMSLLLHL